MTGGETIVLSVSDVRRVLFNIKDTWAVCERVCVVMCFVTVLFMCSVFLGDCIFHSLCSAPEQGRGEEEGGEGKQGGLYSK